MRLVLGRVNTKSDHAVFSFTKNNITFRINYTVIKYEGEADDDICVWQHGGPSSDTDDTDEPLAGHFRKLGAKFKDKESDVNIKKTKSTGKTDGPKMSAETTPPKSTERVEAAGIPLSHIDPNTGKLTKEAFRERELQYALSETRRNLTHISQFLLKLEARAGKTTKEGIRQTLDATVRDLHYDFNACGSEGAPPDPDHKGEIEELKHLSVEVYNRLYLVDRHWRRLSREARDAEGRSPDIGILSESDIKEWIRVELRTNDLAAEETCFYTVHDLTCNRSFREWITYLQMLCNFGAHHSDQVKLVELAWRFLDRNLRGPRPVNPTSVEQFIAELDTRRRSGIWDEIRKHPKKQEEEDAEAWKTMRKYWSSRTAPG
ncbi:hypothetical protein F5B21DRAFT_525231 [Xylaria acuta]|nr:hypothetical protein F5B21DRAFT_525231 [Xylaria acuta]